MHDSLLEQACLGHAKLLHRSQMPRSTLAALT
jgi:hypothetical protein